MMSLRIIIYLIVEERRPSGISDARGAEGYALDVDGGVEV